MCARSASNTNQSSLHLSGASSFLLSLLLLSALLTTRAFLLPETEAANEFIERGDPNLVVKAVFSCHRNFQAYPLSNIEVFQESPEMCAEVAQNMSCMSELEQNDHWFKEDCLRNEFRPLEKMLNKANFGSIGFPTHEWEMPSWIELQKWNYTVAIPSEETLRLCGENTVAFQNWLTDNGFSRFQPKTFASFEEAKCPCLLKPRPIVGRDSSRAVTVHSKDELRKELTSKGADEVVLIQESIDSKASVVVHFIAYKGRLMNRFSCRVRYKGDDEDLRLNPNFIEQNFKAPCRNVPGFADEIRPFLKSMSDKLKLNGIAYLHVKLLGVDSDELFYGNDELVREWKRKNKTKSGESFVKVLEMHARVGGGLQTDAKVFGKMIRAFALAHFADYYERHQYDHALFSTHFRRVKEGDAPEYIAFEV